MSWDFPLAIRRIRTTGSISEGFRSHSEFVFVVRTSPAVGLTDGSIAFAGEESAGIAPAGGRMR